MLQDLSAYVNWSLDFANIDIAHKMISRKISMDVPRNNPEHINQDQLEKPIFESHQGQRLQFYWGYEETFFIFEFQEIGGSLSNPSIFGTKITFPDLRNPHEKDKPVDLTKMDHYKILGSLSDKGHNMYKKYSLGDMQRSRLFLYEICDPFLEEEVVEKIFYRDQLVPHQALIMETVCPTDKKTAGIPYVLPNLSRIVPID